MRTQPEIRDASPGRALMRLVLNAILYATSAGVSPDVRAAARPRRGARVPAPVRSSDSIFFLAGKIDIRRVRELQELSRAPGGGAILARFLVRGHWRRPPKNWTDQRLRWIEPYWKGPDMAAVIEKVAAAPEHAPAHYQLGQVWLVLGVFDRARDAWKRAVDAAGPGAEETESAARALFNLGVFHVESGAREQGRRHLRRALELLPDYPAARGALAQLEQIEVRI